MPARCAASLNADACKDDAQISRVAAVFEASTGIDLGAYRPGMVQRRVRNRMIALGLSDAACYLQRLRADPREPSHLLDRLAIKVSRFYRNAAAFDTLRSRYLPELARARGRCLRVRSVGCARGEEAWTLAMLLDEAGIAGTVDASDVDPGAFAVARQRLYPDGSTVELPEALRSRYLERLPASAGARRWRVSARLAPRVRFFRDDLLGAASLPTGGYYDLVVCRNVLIYFVPAAQERAFGRLCDLLLPGGVLFLGESEWPAGTEAVRRLVPLGVRDRLFIGTDQRACA